MRRAWMILLTMPLAMPFPGVAAPLQLSLKRAVEIAVSPEGNTSVQLSGEAFKQAQARSLEARAALLPNLEASVTQESRTENLAALGLDSVVLPVPGFHFPTLVGPFSTFDARVTAT